LSVPRRSVLPKTKLPPRPPGWTTPKWVRIGALAQLSFQAFQKGDNATAAELARILERTWDAAEEGGGDRTLANTNKDLFEQIDRAMRLHQAGYALQRQGTPSGGRANCLQQLLGQAQARRSIAGKFY
jgi:hypothetical protein